MRTIIVAIPLILHDSEKNQIPLQNNVEYVVPDIIPDLLDKEGFKKHIIKNEDFYEGREYKLYRGQNLDNKTLIFFRSGGIGDLIFPLPAIKTLKEKYPTCKVYACCNEAYRCLFEELDYIEDVISLPLRLDDLTTKDYYTNFEGLIEGNPDAEKVNAYDLHATKFFVKPENMAPELKVNENVEKQVKMELMKWSNQKKIVVAFSSSVAIRGVDPAKYRELIDSVNDQNVKWFMIGTGGQQKEMDLFIRSCKNKNKIVNWSRDHKDLVQTMALIKNSDCVIAPDSGLIHIAGGFGIPVIGLYGAFHSSLRMKYYRNAVGVDAMSTCVFARGDYRCCFQHGTGSCNLARKVYERYSPCMQVIKVKDMKKALEVLKIFEFKKEEIKK